MDPEEVLTTQHALIERVIRYAARRHGLSPLDSDDFASSVWLRLVEDDYAILRSFRGRSSLQTYLTVVIVRQCLDYMTARRGKWHPSTEATRLGATAVQLERLVYRDGQPVDQACASIAAADPGLQRDDLYRLLCRLPRRPARRFVGDENVELLPANVLNPEEELARDAENLQTTKALVGALGRLDAQARLLLKLRFVDALSVSSIARQLNLDRARLYRRFSTVLRQLKQDMRATMGR